MKHFYHKYSGMQISNFFEVEIIKEGRWKSSIKKPESC